MNATDTPKAIPIAAPGEGTIATRVAAGLGLRPTLLEEWHFLRLAIVYVRQSDPQQVLNYLELRERQYALVDLAAAMGWPRDRILLIDEDQGITGKTAERRTGGSDSNGEKNNELGPEPSDFRSAASQNPRLQGLDSRKSIRER